MSTTYAWPDEPDEPVRVSPYGTQWEPLGSLIITQACQRSVDPDDVRRIAANWDPRVQQPVTALTLVGQPEGTLTVADGQNTTLAAIMRFGREAMIEVRYVGGPYTIAEASALGFDINLSRRRPGAIQLWYGAIQQGVPAVIAVNNVIQSLGLVVGKGPESSTIGCIATIRSYVNNETTAPALVERALRSLLIAFPDEQARSRGRFHGNVVHPVLDVMDRNPSLTAQQWAEMSLIPGPSPATLIADNKQTRAWIGIGDDMVLQFAASQKGRRNKVELTWR